MENKKECLTLSEMKALIHPSSENIILMDVRNPEEFVEKHIPGFINIPLPELENHLTEWSSKNTLVTICGKGGGRSASAAEILKSSGFLNSFYLCGGTFGWYENKIKVD